jgi:hypothetical protein
MVHSSKTERIENIVHLMFWSQGLGSRSVSIVAVFPIEISTVFTAQTITISHQI